jgi:hypothetical protein
MGRAAKLKKERRKMHVWEESNKHMSNGDWLALAKHFEKYGEQVLDENMQPIKFKSIEEHAKYLEEKFTKSARANKISI